MSQIHGIRERVRDLVLIIFFVALVALQVLAFKYLPREPASVGIAGSVVRVIELMKKTLNGPSTFQPVNDSL